MRHFWQWLCGYVCILLNGRQVSRFLNLCSKNGICLWKISQEAEHQIRVHIRLYDFYDIKPYLRKTKTKVKILSKTGFPFWCYRHPYLKWMLLGVVLFFFMFLYQFQFIHEIKIYGNDRIDTYELEEFIEEQNIATGMKKKDVDCTDLEYRLRQNFGEMGWVSVYIEHTTLFIEIKESLYDEFEFTPDETEASYHLVAERDAVISSIVTREGKALVTKGQSVKAGDILVLGECDILDDDGFVKEVLHLRADALIYGEVKRKYILPVSEMELISLNLSKHTSSSMLSFFANQKISPMIKNLEENGVIILNKHVMIEKKEKHIVLVVELTTQEQIGINMPMEE